MHKWLYSIQNKHRFALTMTILMVCILVVNVLNNRQVDALHYTMDQVYEDRLIAESYIYSLSRVFHHKKSIIMDCSPETDFSPARKAVLSDNKEITSILAMFEATRLTPEEQSVFNQLKQSVQALGGLEQKFIGNPASDIMPGQDKEDILQGYNTVFAELSQLSDIQLKEGRMLRDKAKKLVSGHTLLGNLELIFVVIIGILILNMIFAAKSIRLMNMQHSAMN
jgi:hypothetical protein